MPTATATKTVRSGTVACDLAEASSVKVSAWITPPSIRTSASAVDLAHPPNRLSPAKKSMVSSVRVSSVRSPPSQRSSLSALALISTLPPRTLPVMATFATDEVMSTKGMTTAKDEHTCVAISLMSPAAWAVSPSSTCASNLASCFTSMVFASRVSAPESAVEAAISASNPAPICRVHTTEFVSILPYGALTVRSEPPVSMFWRTTLIPAWIPEASASIVTEPPGQISESLSHVGLQRNCSRPHSIRDVPECWSANTDCHCPCWKRT